MSHEESRPGCRLRNRSGPCPNANAADGTPSESTVLPSIPQTLYDFLHASIDEIYDENRVSAAKSAAADASATGTEPVADGDPQEMLIHFGRLLRVWRISLGYTRAQLATQLALEGSTLLALEQGLVTPSTVSPDQLVAIVNLLVDKGPPNDSSPSNSL